MSIFTLPDLGEGLMEAEIREWFVKVGDEVKVDQTLVSVETAKAVVDVPSPESGRITVLHGKPGDLIQTGSPLIEFESGNSRKDNGSVVGSLEQSNQSLDESAVIVGSPKTSQAAIKAMPAVRALAKELGVDLTQIKGSGGEGQIIAEDVKQVAGSLHPETETLRGVRRVMSEVMTQSHQEIVPVSIFEDVDITDLKEPDLTACIIQAMLAGIKKEPALNASFDGKQGKRTLHTEMRLGLAVDTQEGLFVPVLKNLEAASIEALRQQINQCKEAVKTRKISPSDLQGASISLSNFGMIAGRYATPVIVPPMVAILACGRVREVPAVHQNQIQIRKMLPLSLTFDHRAVTGGEATRFLAIVIQALEERR